MAAARPGQDGKRCIDKVEMVEETEYDDVVQCDHSYDTVESTRIEPFLGENRVILD